MRVNKEKVLFGFRIFLVLMMLGTLVFIFVNSCLPKEISSEESAAVGGFITSLIPEDTDLYRFVTEYIRKIAHFTEYGMLGIEIAVYIMIYGKGRVRLALLSSLIPLFVGFTDETIQILSDRGPSISDVWIDLGGFIFFSLIAWGGMCLSVFLYKLILKEIAKNGKKRSRDWLR